MCVWGIGCEEVGGGCDGVECIRSTGGNVGQSRMGVYVWNRMKGVGVGMSEW